jgi:hypothetical protein
VVPQVQAIVDKIVKICAATAREKVGAELTYRGPVSKGRLLGAKVERTDVDYGSAHDRPSAMFPAAEQPLKVANPEAVLRHGLHPDPLQTLAQGR